MKDPENSDSIISFLKENGFSKSQLERVVKTDPRLLSASLEKTIKPKIKIFQDLGFSANDIVDIISNAPTVLHRSADHRVTPSLSVLKSLFGSSSEVAKVLKRSGWFLINHLEKTMVPNIEIFKSRGVGMEQIIKHISNFPRFLLHSPNDMNKFVKKVDEMGTCRSSKMFIHAVRVVSSMKDENWELELKHFSNLGFSEDDIFKMFKKAPPVFAVSQRKLKNVKEFLLATGKYDISCIVSHPIPFLCSLEKKIKPRMLVLGILESRNLIGKWEKYIWQIVERR
ncbi:Mitochondrial transcription termination factor family protein [Abeliophyllum distichum]|uniref:Mitochondrial transcription termination factor family protein n=1 Tax=Abeliophyllum distichum TaxID=126358 RepID=A0ABD1Q721_9LAMI